MRIGTLRKRVTLQGESPASDGAGGYTLGWSDVATVWAEISPVSGNEAFTAQHLEGHVTHRVTMRYYAGITTDMRVSYNSRLFNIRAVLNTDERNQWTELLVEEGARNMTDVFFNVQQGVFNALAASSALQSLIGSPVRLYDHVPPGVVFPYVAFGPVTASPFDTKTETGVEQIITLNIWSRYRGGKEAKDILQATYDALHRANVTVSGEVFLSCEFHSADITGLDDGLTTHAAARYTIVTQST